MGEAVFDFIKNRYRQSHASLFELVEGLTEEQWTWRPTPQAHNIAFQVWHLGRMNDHVQAKIAKLTPDLERRFGPAHQIWMAEGLARKWDLDPAKLGQGESGFGMEDAVAASLRLPEKAVILQYVRRVCTASEHVVDALTDDQLLTLKTKDWAGDLPVGAHIVEYLAHDEWILGTVAALRRAQGLPRVFA